VCILYTINSIIIIKISLEFFLTNRIRMKIRLDSSKIFVSRNPILSRGSDLRSEKILLEDDRFVIGVYTSNFNNTKIWIYVSVQELVKGDVIIDFKWEVKEDMNAVGVYAPWENSKRKRGAWIRWKFFHSAKTTFYLSNVV